MTEPKRILALDGGGIRGVFTLQILTRIEELFRQEQKIPTPFSTHAAPIFNLSCSVTKG
jgi:patatin-like phospholipase/acyl hydrolase